MKLFISYRHKTPHFAQRLVEKLALYIQDEVFIDLDGVDKADFEKSILGHLQSSNVVLLLVTEYTFSDQIHKDNDWVRREILEAITHNIPIVLVCDNGLLPPPAHTLPDDIKNVTRNQGIPFYPEYFMPGVERLVEFLVKIGVATLKNRQAITEALSHQIDKNPFEEQKPAFLELALHLIESDELDKVEKGIFILEELIKAGNQSRIVKHALEDSRNHREELLLERTARDEYEEIRVTAGIKRIEQVALDEFSKWIESYPNLVEKLDYENLRSRIQKPAKQTTEAEILLAELEDVNLPHTTRLQIGKRLAVIGDPRSGIDVLPNGIPDILWCSVSEGGNVSVSTQNQTYKFDIRPFYVAKYLTTYAQYQAFVKAKDGYKNKQWWKLFPSEYRPQKLDTQKHKISNAPRDSLSWYQSMAFAHWLDAKYRELGLFESILNISSVQWRITLPPEWYWQWVAQSGNDNQRYPWGDSDDLRLANTYESKINETTSVGMYPQGIATCGALDIAGNLYEWCLNDYYSLETMNGYSNEGTKTLRGISTFIESFKVLDVMSRNLAMPYKDSYSYGCRLFICPIVAVL